MRKLAMVVGAVTVVSCGTTCGPEGPAAAGYTVRDSASIRIVESFEPAWGEGEGWTLSAEPILEIGVVEGEAVYQFDGVRDVARAPNGNIVVADGGTQEIRIYDPQGRSIRILGGRGEGPGEFRGLASVLWAPADTIVGFDVVQRRANAFAPDGSLAWSTGLDIGGVLGPPGRFEDGSYAWATANLGEALSEIQAHPGEIVRIDAFLLRYSAESGVPDTVASFRGIDYSSWQSPGGSTAFGFPLFGHRTTYTIRGTRAYVGFEDRYEIRTYESDGSLARILRRLDLDLSVTPEVVDSLVEVLLTEDAPDDRQTRTEYILARPVAERRTPYGDIRADPGEHLWVSNHHAGAPFPGVGSPTVWSVFDPEGRWLGDVAGPDHFRMVEVGEDYVLGLATDELDVEHVRIYGLTR